jgi:DNA modification methylase
MSNFKDAKSGHQVTNALADKTRRRRDELKGEVALEAIAAGARRNDLIPNMNLVTRAVAELRAPQRNVRKLDKLHQAEIASSIAELGFAAPVIITPAGEVIDGMNKVEAARAMGVAEVPCVEVAGLSPARVKLLRTALNRLGEKGGWDFEELKVEFEELVLENAPISFTGFSEQEIDILLEGPVADEKANAYPDAGTDVPPVSKEGDLWLLGRHRVLCADATKPESYARLFGDTPPARAVFTDPPYNIKIDGFAVGAEKHKEFVAASGEMSDEEFTIFLADFLIASARHLTDGGILYACMDWRHGEHVYRAARAAALSVMNVVVWSKGNGGLGGLYRSAHELVFVLKKGNGPHINNVELGKHGRDRTNVWSYPGANRRGSSANAQAKNHPTPKPVELVADAMLDVTHCKDVVLDPFLGSGTSVIAAEKTGRTAYGLELDPHYVDVIVRRYQDYTGLPARHAETGRLFDEIANEYAAEVTGQASSKATSSVTGSDTGVQEEAA